MMNNDLARRCRQTARMALRCELGLICAVLGVVACTPRRVSQHAPRGELLVRAAPDVVAHDGTLWIDGSYVAPVVPRAFALRAGRHFVEVRAGGYYTGYWEVVVRPGLRTQLHVALQPKLP